MNNVSVATLVDQQTHARAVAYAKARAIPVSIVIAAAIIEHVERGASRHPGAPEAGARTKQLRARLPKWLFDTVASCAGAWDMAHGAWLYGALVEFLDEADRAQVKVAQEVSP